MNLLEMQSLPLCLSEVSVLNDTNYATARRCCEIRATVQHKITPRNDAMVIRVSAQNVRHAHMCRFSILTVAVLGSRPASAMWVHVHARVHVHVHLHVRARARVHVRTRMEHLPSAHCQSDRLSLQGALEGGFDIKWYANGTDCVGQSRNILLWGNP